MNHNGDELKTSPYPRPFILTQQVSVAVVCHLLCRGETRDGSGTERTESARALDVDCVPLKCWLQKTICLSLSQTFGRKIKMIVLRIEKEHYYFISSSNTPRISF